jgi:hypothetical protein
MLKRWLARSDGALRTAPPYHRQQVQAISERFSTKLDPSG